MKRKSNPARGGRRHGLSPAGESRRVVVRLGPSELADLATLTAMWRCTPSEAIRTAIAHAADLPDDA